jgi:hypothetical protein
MDSRVGVTCGSQDRPPSPERRAICAASGGRSIWARAAETLGAQGLGGVQPMCSALDQAVSPQKRSAGVPDRERACRAVLDGGEGRAYRLPKGPAERVAHVARVGVAVDRAAEAH